jgi:hypothetical protein
MTSLRWYLGTSLIGLSLAACGGDGGGSIMQFQWKLGAGVTCGEDAIVQIRATLTNAQTKKLARAATNFDCGLATGGKLNGVSPGTYTLLLEGYTAGATKASYTATITGAIVKPTDKTTELGVVRLAKIPDETIPSALRIQWPFMNGLGCEANGIKDVRITAWRSKRFLEHDKTYACGSQRTDLLLPPGTYSIILEGITADGSLGVDAQKDDVTNPPADANPIVIQLTEAVGPAGP